MSAAAEVAALTRGERDGFEVLRLASAQVSVAVVPGLGGRVCSMLHRTSDREWLAWPAGERLRRVPAGTPFHESTHIGIDDCIPTIAACMFRGRALPDHGSVWSEAWALDRAALARGVIATEVAVPGTRLRLKRAITVHAAEVRFAYEVVAEGREPEPFLWSWHPLFAIERGDRTELPAEVDQMDVEYTLNPGVAVARGDALRCRDPEQGIDLYALQLNADGAPAALKAFSRPLRQGWAALANPARGGRLELNWDATVQPTLGLWLTRGGYRGWHQVALEPCSGAPDSLAEAFERGRCLIAHPGQPLRWHVTATLAGAG